MVASSTWRVGAVHASIGERRNLSKIHYTNREETQERAEFNHGGRRGHRGQRRGEVRGIHRKAAKDAKGRKEERILNRISVSFRFCI
jgi:hypothetical protein